MKRLARRDFLKITGALAMAAPRPLGGQSQVPCPRPNILVFFTDDHGQWAQRAYGNTEIQSPHLDKLASRGVRMTRAFTPCPVCSPARASGAPTVASRHASIRVTFLEDFMIRLSGVRVGRRGIIHFR